MRKIQLKTLLILKTAFIIIIGIIYSLITIPFVDFSYDDFYNLLKIKARTVAEVEIEGKKLEDMDPNTFRETLLNERDFVFKVSENENLTQGAKKLGVPVSFIKAVETKGESEYHNDTFFYKGLRYTKGDDTYVVIVGAENHYAYSHAGYLKKAIAAAAFFSVIFSLFISIYLSKYIFNPLIRITNRVKQISTENLHLRLDLKGNNDEMDVLADTFNDMLDRIEASFEIQNNFVSNASHELRTPLTAIIGEADVTLSKVREPEEYIETIKIILEEAEKLDEKTKALLFLAQTGFDGKVVKFTKVRIDQLLWDVKETLERINPHSSINLDTSLMPDDPLKLKVNGNEQLLHLAFSNIISNACKYSNYKPVHVSIAVSDTKVIVVVNDRGIGIPERELSHIYDTFYRASNTKNFEGYGIGLPLTRNIIRSHKGDISVFSEEGKGTVVQVKMPAVYAENHLKESF